MILVVEGVGIALLFQAPCKDAKRRSQGSTVRYPSLSFRTQFSSSCVWSMHSSWSLVSTRSSTYMMMTTCSPYSFWHAYLHQKRIVKNYLSSICNLPMLIIVFKHSCLDIVFKHSCLANALFMVTYKYQIIHVYDNDDFFSPPCFDIMHELEAHFLRSINCKKLSILLFLALGACFRLYKAFFSLQTFYEFSISNLGGYTFSLRCPFRNVVLTSI